MCVCVSMCACVRAPTERKTGSVSACAGAAVRVLWLYSMHNDVDISEGQQTVLSWGVTAASARSESRRFLSVLHCTVSLNQSPGGERRCVCSGGGGGGG